MRWEFGSVLPQDIKYNLSELEVMFPFNNTQIKVLVIIYVTVTHIRLLCIHLNEFLIGHYIKYDIM